MQEAGPWEHSENLDTWRDADRNTGEAHGSDPGPCCSFCGSLHPETFLALISEGWAVEPTDKDYKAYLHEVLDLPEQTARPGEPLPPIRNGRAKFYYQHLSEAQMQRFVDLYNDNTMRLATPGYFYRLPYFMAVGSP
jgi:hypothetical protein